jgi:hypothetical protein
VRPLIGIIEVRIGGEPVKLLANNRIDDNSSYVEIEADGGDQVLFVLAPTVVQIRDMEARRGLYADYHKSFSLDAKRMLEWFVTAGISDSDADAIIEGLLDDEEDEMITHRIVDR